METKTLLSPEEIIASACEIGIKKAHRPAHKQLLLAFMAGAFIAFGASGSNMVGFNLLAGADTYGLGKLCCGLVFGTGLMLVILSGSELFTGNMLMSVSLLDKNIKLRELFRNWICVYSGNFIGALFVAASVFLIGQFGSGDGLLGGVTIKIAYGKATLPFHNALISGILCNWMVCLAVFASIAASDVTGKILAIFFVICLFVVSGFEHCIANMYYIPAGILAKSNDLWVARSGLSAEQLNMLTWGSLTSLLPVTIGNIIGGVIFAWVPFRYAFRPVKH